MLLHILGICFANVISTYLETLFEVKLQGFVHQFAVVLPEMFQYRTILWGDMEAFLKSLLYVNIYTFSGSRFFWISALPYDPDVIICQVKWRYGKIHPRPVTYTVQIVRI